MTRILWPYILFQPSQQTSNQTLYLAHNREAKENLVPAKKTIQKKARALLLVIDIWTCFAHSVDFPTSNVTSSFARIMKAEFIRSHQ